MLGYIIYLTTGQEYGKPIKEQVMKDEPVFPNQVLSNDWKEKTEWYEHYQLVGGLTKREYFAGLAMQGQLQISVAMLKDDFVTTPEQIAKGAIIIADALLKGLEREKD